MQTLPGDSTIARWALVRGGLGRGWTRILGAPRNAAIIETLRDLTESGVQIEYLKGAMVVKGIGFNDALWRRMGGNVQGGLDRTEWSKFIEIPGDARLAGAWIVAAIVSGRELRLERVFVDAALEHLIALLSFAGLKIERRRTGERMSTIRVWPSALRGFSVDTAVVDRTMPLLAVAATAASSTSIFTVRGRENRGLLAMLRELGVQVREHGAGFAIDGPQQIASGTVRCHGDVDLGLAACVAAMGTKAIVRLDDPEPVVLAYPHIVEQLKQWSGEA